MFVCVVILLDLSLSWNEGQEGQMARLLLVSMKQSCNTVISLLRKGISCFWRPFLFDQSMGYSENGMCLASPSLQLQSLQMQTLQRYGSRLNYATWRKNATRVARKLLLGCKQCISGKFVVHLFHSTTICGARFVHGNFAMFRPEDEWCLQTLAGKCGKGRVT